MRDFLVIVYFAAFFNIVIRFSEELPIVDPASFNNNFTDIDVENLPANATLSTGELAYHKVIINPLCNGVGCGAPNAASKSEEEPVIVDNHC